MIAGRNYFRIALGAPVRPTRKQPASVCLLRSRNVRLKPGPLDVKGDWGGGCKLISNLPWRTMLG